MDCNRGDQQQKLTWPNTQRTLSLSTSDRPFLSFLGIVVEHHFVFLVLLLVLYVCTHHFVPLIAF